MDYVELARQKALQYGLDPDLFIRQIQAESAFRPDAVSSAGAIGLGQLMPATARELGVDPSNPAQNLDGAARYMRQQLDTFGNYPMALAAYNAGPSRVQKAGGIPNITETQNYVSKIMGAGGSAMNANTNILGAAQAAEEEYKKEQAGKPLFQRDSFKDIAGDLAVAFNSMRLKPDDNIVRAVESIRTQRTEAKARNKTLEMMTKIGRDDLAAAVQSGALTAKEAYGQMLSDAAELRKAQAKGGTTALIRNALAAGLQPNTPEFRQFIVSGGDIYNQETQLLANLPKPEKGMRYQFDRDETGRITNYRLVPIAGSSADVERKEVETAAKAREEDQLQKDYTFFGAGSRVIDAIDNDPTLIPKTGIIAGMVADTVFGQKQRDVAEDLAIMESQMQFETLADLKRQSPTGASGLGQLTDAERRALGKIEQNFSNLQGEDAVKRTIRSATLMRTYMKNGIKDTETGKYRNATEQELEMMVQGINPFGAGSGAMLEGLPRGIFATSGSAQGGVAPATTSPTVTHRFNPETGKVEPVK